MSETKHTPGPWFAKPSVHGSEYKYVQIGADETYTTLEVLPADAILIAAAPALLAALLRLTAGMNESHDSNPAVKADEVKQARAAITEATGEAP